MTCRRLPAYSESDATCVKCGWVGADTEYVRAAYHGGEVLRRTCSNCGFDWDEALIGEPAHTGRSDCAGCAALKGPPPQLPGE